MQTDQPETQQHGNRDKLPKVVRVLLPLGMLAIGWIGFSILSVEPDKTKIPEGKKRGIKTRVVELQVQDFTTTIRTRGIVRPHNEVTLTPQVAGKISRILPGFEDGTFFKEGDVLMELDPQDYESAVIVAQAQIARADAAHKLEQTRAKQAKLNWDDLGLDEEPNDLVLRLPQLREAKAIVDSATAQLEQAKRNLERTKVRALFNGRVRHRSVGLGQSAGPGTPLGTVFTIDFAEVRLPIASRDIKFLSLPEGPEDPPIEVELRDSLNHNDTIWKAKIIRTEGTLDPASLELFAIARVIDPFGRKSGHPPLRIGQPVAASISGHVLKKVIVVPREGVQQLDRILLVDPADLTISSRNIEPIWSDEKNVVIRDTTIPDGTLLAVTRIHYAPIGSKVEIMEDPVETVTEVTTTDELSTEKPSKKED
jgi:RND family efflux transporter MFP subunit